MNVSRCVANQVALAPSTLCCRFVDVVARLALNLNSFMLDIQAGAVAICHTPPCRYLGLQANCQWC